MPDLLIPPDINVRSTRYFIASRSGTCWHCQASIRVIALGLPPGHQTLDVDDDERPIPLPAAAPNGSAEGTAGGTEGTKVKAGKEINDAAKEDNEAAPRESEERRVEPTELKEKRVALKEDLPELQGERPALKGDHLELQGEPHALKRDRPELQGERAALEGQSPATNTRESTWSIASHNAFLFYIDYLPETIQSRLRAFTQSYRFGYCDATASSYWANHCECCNSLLDDHELFCEPDGAFLPTNTASAALIHLLPIDESIEAAAAGYAYEPAFFGAMTPGSPPTTRSR